MGEMPVNTLLKKLLFARELFVKLVETLTMFVVMLVMGGRCQIIQKRGQMTLFAFRSATLVVIEIKAKFVLRFGMRIPQANDGTIAV